MVAAIGVETAGRIGVGDIGLVDGIARPAAELRHLRGRQRRLDIVHFLRDAADLHVLRGVVPFLQMREPVMRHELNPEGRDHVEERRLLVIAVRAITVVAGGGIRLVAGKEAPADDLGIGGQQRNAPALPVHGAIAIVAGGVDVQIREGGFEFHIAAKHRARGTHQGIGKIIADAAERSEPDQLALA